MSIQTVDRARLADPLRDLPPEALARLEGRRGYMPVDPDRGEFKCDECGSRCTRGPKGTEFGHRSNSSSRGQCSRWIGPFDSITAP